jgi:hypothetical protein
MEVEVLAVEPGRPDEPRRASPSRDNVEPLALLTRMGESPPYLLIDGPSEDMRTI